MHNFLPVASCPVFWHHLFQRPFSLVPQSMLVIVLKVGCVEILAFFLCVITASLIVSCDDYNTCRCSLLIGHKPAHLADGKST